MPRNCTACMHPQRDAIDLALLSGETLRAIAKRFGVSVAAVNRHRDHLPGQLVKAQEAAEAVSAGTLLERLMELNAQTREILRETREAGNHDLALKAIARVEKQLELEGKLIGELNEGPTVNIFSTPEWVSLRALVLKALHPYPDAARAVGKALREPAG